jgi:hypothetical protein
MENVQAGLCDATVYESYITYPTDAKLIWKSCTDVFAMLQDVRKRLKLRCSRSKHDKRQQGIFTGSMSILLVSIY